MSAFSGALSAAALPRHGGDALAADAPAALSRARAFHTIDALRGVAALCVLLFHAAFFFDLALPAEGYLAVDLFFVMSGFIIAHRYESDLSRGMSVRRFAKVRLVRLYPLFLLGTLLGAIPALAAIVGGHADRLQGSPHLGLVASLPLAVMMLPSRLAMPDLTVAYPLNYVSWSLALELLVNVAFAATFRVWTLRRLGLLVAASFVGLALVAWRHGSLNVGWDWGNAIGGVPRVVFGFSVGVVLFRLHAARPFALRVPWWALVVAVPALLFLDPVALGLGVARPAWDVALATLVVPAIVVAAIANEPPKAAQGACALAGVYSYVLYSLHAPFVGLFMRGEERLHLDLQATSPARALVFATLLAMLCVVAHAGYDKPVRAWLTTRRAGRARPPSPASGRSRERGPCGARRNGPGRRGRGSPLHHPSGGPPPHGEDARGSSEQAGMRSRLTRHSAPEGD